MNIQAYMETAANIHIAFKLLGGYPWLRYSSTRISKSQNWNFKPIHKLQLESQKLARHIDVSLMKRKHT